MIPILLVLTLSSLPAPTMAPQTGPVGTIPGDRLGFEQPLALNQAPITAYTWTIFIDNVGAPFAGVTCVTRTPPTVADCVGALPPMTTGNHTIELIAHRTEAGIEVQSVRSAPFLVTSLGITSAPRQFRIIRPAP